MYLPHLDEPGSGGAVDVKRIGSGRGSRKQKRMRENERARGKGGGGVEG